jgi:PAS domain S-box-containing protein
MDIDLGEGMDGTQAAGKILSNRDLPIVFLTSHTEKEMVQRVKDITSYGYVIKNSGEFVLIESINMAFELFEANSILKTREIEYHEIVDAIDSAIVKIDEEGKIRFFSRGAEKIFGYRAEEVIGKVSSESINPEFDSNGSNMREMIRHIYDNPEKYQLNENENRTKDGRILQMSWHNSIVRDHLGNKLYILCLGNDFTEINAAKNALKKSEELFHKAFRRAPALMSISELETGTFIDVNDYFCLITGFVREEVLGRTSTASGFISTETREAIITTINEAGRAEALEISINHKSGRQIKCLYSGDVIETGGGKILLSMARELHQ